MYKIFANRVVFICLLMLLFSFKLNSQIEENIINKSEIDTLMEDGIELIKLEKKEKKSDIDTVIFYTSQDSARYSVKDRKLRLKGKSNIDYQNRKLSSEIIDIYFENSLLDAYPGIEDSVKFGYPQFSEAGEEYAGERIKFNMKTSKGLISLGETELEEGFYFGESIKRISQNEFFIKDGYYTTCSAPHPHYYFGSPRMKMVAQDKIFLDPLILYVEDLPVMIVPFGLFFSTESGRRSGVMIPVYDFSRNRGASFRNFGFYWAASDYFDSQVTADIWSKGGYMIRNTSRWHLLNEFRGDVTVAIGKTRLQPDVEYDDNYEIRLHHNQDITPQDKVDVNLNFVSNNYNRNTALDLNSRVNQNAVSNASYFKSFDNGQTMSVSYQRNQNIIDGTYDQRIPISYNIPQIKLGKLLGKDFTFSYRGTYNHNTNLRKEILRTTNEFDEIFFDTNFRTDISRNVIHAPVLQYNLPRLGSFNITPNLNFGLSNFFRRGVRSYDELNNREIIEYEDGFFSEYYASFGIAAQTRIFGIADDRSPFLWVLPPSLVGLKAVRHTLEPSINLAYTPDFSGEQFGFYDTYQRLDGREVRYNYFQADGGGRAPANRSLALSYNIRNKIEAKLMPKDTMPDVNLELLQLDMSGNYDFTRDSLNFSNINLSFRTPALQALNFNGSAELTLYDEDRLINPNNNQISYNRVNRLLLNTPGQFPARLTRISLAISTAFSSEGLGPGSNDMTFQDTTRLGVGERFLARQRDSYNYYNYWGDNDPGFMESNATWSVNLGLNYTYNQATLLNKNENLTLNIDGNLKFTSTWTLRASMRYDVLKKEMLTPSVVMNKMLDCWNLSFTWNPLGFNRGFFLRFGINAAQLQDLFVEKRNSPILR